MKKKQPLFIKIADILRKKANKSSDRYFPSLRSLCETYKVSPVTMSKALRVLKEEGVVNYSQGKHIEITKNNKTTLTSSAIKLKNHLQKKIEDGSYKIGYQLPKISFFALSENISRTTVCTALKMLSNAKLIHKQGKKWIVGPNITQIATYSSNSHGRRYVIVVITTDENEKNYYWREPDSRAFEFGQNFYSVVEDYGIEIIHAYINPEDEKWRCPAGDKNVKKMISSLGGRYRGTLLLTAANKDTHEGEDWIPWLLKFNQPVVWFNPDINNKGINVTSLPNVNKFVQCLYTEETASKLAISVLAERGHKKVAIPFARFSEDYYYNWVQVRMTLVKNAAKKSKVSIIPIEQNEPFWYDLDIGAEKNDGHIYDINLHKSYVREEKFDKFLNSLMEKKRRLTMEQRGGKQFVSNEQTLSVTSPSLSRIVSTPGVTAIIAPDIQLARLYARWLDKKGIVFPDDISLLGFDNDVNSRSQPISTINLGFGRLAYRVAHFIIGDIPVHVNKRREMYNIPWLMDRGSLRQV